MKKSGSVTHDHLLLVLNSELAGCGERDVIRVLEMGCGNCQLMAFLLDRLREENPGLRLEMHGFDVSDSNVQASGYFQEALRWLAEACPGEPWSERIRQIASSDPWPYPDKHFDFVISNQVMEHVSDPVLALAQMRRVLKDGGRCFHLFPLVHYWYEGHLLIPFVHWIKNHDLLRQYIRVASRLGLGKFRDHQRGNPAKYTLDFYAEEHADYISFFTRYLSKAQLLDLAKSTGLRCSFRYTEWFYINKFRRVFGLAPKTRVALSSLGFWHAFFVFFAARISSVTVMLERKQTYFR